MKILTEFFALFAILTLTAQYYSAYYPEAKGQLIERDYYRL